MKSMLSVSLVGSLLAFVGISVVTGWFGYAAYTVNIMPNHVNMVFNTALCFFLIGMIFLIAGQYPASLKPMSLIAGPFIFFLALATLSQSIFKYSLGLDQLFMHAWLFDQNPYPGRMADNTSLTFMLASLALMLLSFAQKRWLAIIVQVLIFFVMLIGVSGVIGYLLNIEFLYGWYGYSHMAIHTTVCFCLLGVGLWMLWQGSDENQEFYKESDDKKILVLTLIILFSIALISGLLGFAITSKQNKANTENFMQQLLQSKVNILQDAVRDAVVEMSSVMNNPVIRQIITHPDMSNSSVPGANDVLLSTHFSAIKVVDDKNRVLYTRGEFTDSPEMVSELKLPYKTDLIWKDGFKLRLSTELYDGNKSAGTLFLEWPLESFNSAFLGKEEGGKHQAFFVCKLNDTKQVACFPSLPNSQSMQSLLSFSGLEAIKKMMADSQPGVVPGVDFLNKNIVVAYAPVLLLKLSLVVKANTDVTYSTLRQQLRLVIPILLFIVVIGAALLYWRVLPLVQKVMRAKKQASLMNERLASIMDHIAEGVITIDENGVIEECNPKAAEIFGYSYNELIGKNLKMLMPHISRAQSQQGVVVELPGLHKDGHFISMEVTINEVRLGDRHLFVGIMRDISEQHAAQANLLESENRFRSAFDSAAIGMALVSFEGRWMQVNSSLCEILGYSEDELLKKNFQEMIISQDLKKGLDKRRELLENTIKYFQLEERYHHKSGRILWLLISHSLIRSAKDEPLYFIVQIQDITQQKISEEQLSYQAYYDSLTGLENRNQLEHNLARLMESAKRNRQSFAVFFLDLDRFKFINDTFGHDAGDCVLKTIANRLTNLTRKSDIVARLGGDEFVLVLTELYNLEAAASFAESLITVLQEPIQLKENEFFVSASIGISFYPADGSDYNSLIKNADLALYQAKAKGRNNYQFCTPEMNREFQKRVMLEQALYDALMNNEFNLHFQPQFDVVQNRVVGVEALLRWQSRRYGDISPIKIISIAEETGLIIPLGEWVFSTACKHMKVFHDHGFSNLKLAVNMTARQFMHEQLVIRIMDSFAEVGLDLQVLKLEVQESLIIQAFEEGMGRLISLKQHGIEIIAEDFGAGFSSIRSLKDNIVDYIKIDRSLIQNITLQPSDASMIIAIIGLAKNMGVKIIAEGVELKEQYDFLVNNGCNEIQGYYVSHPLSAEDTLQFLINSKCSVVD